MSQENNYIDEAFREEFGNFEVTPPDMVWENIERKLNQKRLVRYITIGSSMAASVALLLTIGLLSNRGSNTFAKVAIQPSAIHFNHTDIRKQETAVLAQTTAQSQPSAILSATVNEGIAASTVNNAASDNTATDIAPQKTIATHSIAKNLESAKVKNTLRVGNETPQIQIIADNSNKNISTTSQFSKQDALTQNATLLTDTTSAKASSLIADNTAGVVSNNLKLTTDEPLDVPQKPKVRRWSVECQVAPLYSYRNISQIDNSSNKKTYNQNENGLLAYSGGFKVNYKTSRRFSIQAGLYYSVMGQTANSLLVQNTSSSQTGSTTTSSKKPALGDAIAVLQTHSYTVTTNTTVVASTTFGKAEVVLSSSTNNAELTQQLKFIEIPLLARYKIIDQKIGLHLLGGLSTDLLVNNNVLLNQDGAKTSVGSTQDVNRFNYSSTFGFGVNYKLFENFDLSIEPTCRYYINSITSTSGLKVHPYTFGVFTGLAYKF
jgi:hypothetical protein